MSFLSHLKQPVIKRTLEQFGWNTPTKPLVALGVPLICGVTMHHLGYPAIGQLLTFAGVVVIFVMVLIVQHVYRRSYAISHNEADDRSSSIAAPPSVRIGNAKNTKITSVESDSSGGAIHIDTSDGVEVGRVYHFSTKNEGR